MRVCDVMDPDGFSALFLPVFLGATMATTETYDDKSKVRRKQEKPPINEKAFGYFVLVAVASCIIRAGWCLSNHYDTAKTISRIHLGVFMLGGAAMRLDSKTMEALLCPIVPPPLPPKLCVYASGIVEALCGVVLLVAPGRYQEFGGLLVVLLLWAVFPANIYHAFSLKAQVATSLAGQEFALYLRIIIQFFFLGWAGWHAGTTLHASYFL